LLQSPSTTRAKKETKTTLQEIESQVSWTYIPWQDEETRIVLLQTQPTSVHGKDVSKVGADYNESKDLEYNVGGKQWIFFGDRVAFSASDSGSLRKCTNQSQSLSHFVAKKKFIGRKQQLWTPTKQGIESTESKEATKQRWGNARTEDKAEKS
jgi:hypothetical protein